MSCPINVFTGRLKTLRLQWKQGGITSAPLDLTEYTASILFHNLASAPTITVTDAVNGRCDLSFPAASTKGLKGIRSLTIAITHNTNPGFSPNPATVEVNIIHD